MKLSKILLAVAVLGSCGLLSSCSESGEKVSMMTFITEIQKISELYLLKIYHGDYLELKEGRSEKKIIYSGEALLGVELTNSEFECEGEKYIIKLPAPSVINIKLIEAECYEVASKGAYFNWKVAAETDLKEKVNKKEYIASAKEQAEQLFKTIFSSRGYTVEIIWKSPEKI